MIFPEMLSQDVLSVGQLNHYLRARLDEDLVLARVWVRGEISNVKFYQAGGQIYFTLKDADAAINCVVFNNVVKDLRFSLTDNLAVVVRGKVSYFEKRGSITLQVYTVEPEGVGALALAFDQLKMKLQQEGLFLESRKKRIPAFPKCVVVITSPSGAVIHDIITTMRRRAPNIKMVIIPTVVQGKDAPASVIHSLDIAKQYGKADVIILARGGGSLEELWAFNNEGVVRAISACSVPVVSAIGHEVDFTLADFVADLRAPTPTAAAELVSPELVRVQVGISDSIRRMKQSLLNHVRDQALLLDDLRARLDHELIHLVQTKSQKLAVCVSKLNALNPLAVLKRGFGHIQGKDGVTIASISQVHVPSTVQVRLWDGSFQCEVTAKR